MDKTIISTEKAPAAVGPYSQAVKANGFIFVSGQLGLIPGTTGFVDGGVAEQTGQALDNLEEILKEAGSGLDKIVKATVLLDDMKDFAAVNEVYASRFVSDPPARAAFAVTTLPLNGLVEIEAIALV
jgi:2-iminobutanoate/2-iminopropanoate deaminase